jgi:hypothetical protein
MATKEDILEQIVEEYLISKGYFVRHNLKFRPSKTHRDYKRREDGNHSDIDVLGYHPRLDGPSRVWAVSCKSWQGGFSPSQIKRLIETKGELAGRPAWKSFRELCIPKWSAAFVEAVREATGVMEFTHVTAVAKLYGKPDAWNNDPDFRKAIDNNPLEIVSFEEMVIEIKSHLSTTLAGSEVGRLLQMFALLERDRERS